MKISWIATSTAAAVGCLEDFRDAVSSELCFIHCFPFPVVPYHAAQKKTENKSLDENHSPSAFYSSSNACR
jgi:hypothetical protein